MEARWIPSDPQASEGLRGPRTVCSPARLCSDSRKDVMTIRGANRNGRAPPGVRYATTSGLGWRTAVGAGCVRARPEELRQRAWLDEPCRVFRCGGKAGGASWLSGRLEARLLRRPGWPSSVSGRWPVPRRSQASGEAGTLCGWEK
jgi:hypothetical protein